MKEAIKRNHGPLLTFHAILLLPIGFRKADIKKGCPYRALKVGSSNF